MKNTIKNAADLGRYATTEKKLAETGMQPDVSPETDKQATEARGAQEPGAGRPSGEKVRLSNGQMPRPRVSLETGQVNESEMRAWEEAMAADRAFRRIEHFTEVMAVAILRNPKVDQLLGRNPLDPGRAGDHANSGAALAHAAHRLAKDYLETIDVLVRGDEPPVPSIDENADLNRPA